MKKIISLFLCLIFAFSLVSCASEEPEIVPEYDSSISEDDIDLDGRTLIMGMVQDYFFEGEDSTLSFTNNTELGDLAAQRLRDVQDKYNCKIEFDYVGRAGEVAFNSAVAGSYIFDFISEESYFLVNYMKANAFVDLTTLENIDVFDESKWGNKNIRMSTMFNGAIYGVLPAAHPMREAISVGNIIVVNEDYVTNLLATDPRDYLENGTWNWETFTDCLNTYAHTSGISNEYVYALSSGFGGFSRELAMSNGVDPIIINENGSFTVGYFEQPAIDAYNQAWDWFYGPTAANVLSEGVNTEDFIAGNSVMHTTSVWKIISTTDSVAYTMDNFGILPVPYGPNAAGPDDYTTSYSSAVFTMCIPITAKDPEISALVLDKIYEPFEGYETKEDIIDYLYKNYFRDTRDAEFLLQLTSGDHIYYHDHYHDFSTMFDQFPNQGIVKGLQSYEEKHYANMEKYVLPAYETMVQYAEYFHE